MLRNKNEEKMADKTIYQDSYSENRKIDVGCHETAHSGDAKDYKETIAIIEETKIFTDGICFPESYDSEDWEVTLDGKSWTLAELISLIKKHTNRSCLYLTVRIYDTQTQEEICSFDTEPYFSVIG